METSIAFKLRNNIELSQLTLPCDGIHARSIQQPMLHSQNRLKKMGAKEEMYR